MTRAFVTGISGQDGSYLADRLLAEGTEVHALAHADEPPVRTAPASSCTRATSPGVDDVRALLLDLAPDEIYNLAALSSVARSWAAARPHRRAVNGAGGGRRCWSRRSGSRRSTAGAVRFVQASSAEIFGEPGSTPQDEATPIRPVNPYGAAKAYAHLMVGVYRRRELHAVSAILYNHESPRRPPQFVTRKITSHRGRHRPGPGRRLALGNLDARRDWGWAPDYVDAMVRAARADRAAGLRGRHRRGPLGPRLRRAAFRAGRHRRLGRTWSRSTPRSSGRPTPPT